MGETFFTLGGICNPAVMFMQIILVWYERKGTVTNYAQLESIFNSLDELQFQAPVFFPLNLRRFLAFLSVEIFRLRLEF